MSYSTQSSHADDYPASSATTGSVAVNGSAVGTLEAGDDQDWFRIELQANHAYRIDLLGAATGDGTLTDPFLYLRDAAGALVAANDDAGFGLNSQLTFRPSVDGIWYIDVGSYLDSSSGTYEIRLHSLAGLDLVGTGGADLLVGSADFDTLSGGGGADTLRGGPGEDLIDGGDDDDTLLGGQGADTLLGGAGNDFFNGAAGFDRLEGGLGDDRYVLRTGSDVIVESAGAGRDTVIFEGFSYVLAAHTERLDMRGTFDARCGGNRLANVLLGNGGDNLMAGGGGRDLLDGRGGADTLIGGTGADTFRFSAAPADGAVGALTDFSPVDDRIALDDATFAAVGPVGALAMEAFRAGADAADANHRVIYDSVTGRLLYDADGSGAGAAVLFATVTPGTAVTAANFWVV